ncbi:NADH-quinone oxidoreductase subunit D [candidate division KSB1 bacterium]
MESGERLVLNYGPSHPAMHGTLRLVVELEGEIIKKSEVHMGYLHSGFEKNCEYLSWNQSIVVTDRMNYLSPLSNNIGYCLAAEKLMNLEVPPRGQYIRVIMLELSRLMDHALWVAFQALDLGAFTILLYGFREREKIYDLFELACGARLTGSYPRVGGLSRDVSDEFITATKAFIEQFPAKLDEIETILTANQIFIQRTRGVGKISADDAIAYGLTGPNLRATGVKWDVRKEMPYSSYDKLDFKVPLGSQGDVYDRYLVRIEEMRQSVEIIKQALDGLPDGKINVLDPRYSLPDRKDVYGSIDGLIFQFKEIMPGHGFPVPTGNVYMATEAPNGELGFMLVSDGGHRPYRMSVRPPSLYHFQAVPHIIKDHMISDIVAIIGSLNIIAGELDR